MDTVEPNWIDLTTLGSSFEEQIDTNARAARYRHRVRSHTGEAEREWIDGPAPMSVGEPIPFGAVFSPGDDTVSLVGKTVAVTVSRSALGSYTKEAAAVTVDGAALQGVTEVKANHAGVEIKTQGGTTYIARVEDVTTAWKD